MHRPSIQQQIDPLHTERAEAERLLGMQDELIIAGLRKGIDTFEAEDKASEMRVTLERMKALGLKQAGRIR
jgi:hypothetical protein